MTRATDGRAEHDGDVVSSARAADERTSRWRQRGETSDLVRRIGIGPGDGRAGGAPGLDRRGRGFLGPGSGRADIRQGEVHCRDVSSSMAAWHRYNSLMGSAKYVVSEMERLDEKLDKRETLEILKAKRKKNQ